MVNIARGQSTACVLYCGNFKHLFVYFLHQERFQSAVMRKRRRSHMAGLLFMYIRSD